MINKKTKLIELTFFILVLSLSFANLISAEDHYCEITTPANCNTLKGDAIMRLSDTTNAHGANASETLYPQVLCCINFEEGLGTTCNGNNTLLRLSSSTNAHAEIPSFSNISYDNNKICYEGFYNKTKDNACYATEDTSDPCGENEIETLYLSDLGNAHLGNTAFSSGAKICCSVKPSQQYCQLSSASWNATEVLEGLKVTMELEGSTFCGTNTQINFSIYDASNNNFKESVTGDYPQRQWTTKLFGATTNKTYYFKANVTSNAIPTNPAQSGNLKVIYDKSEEGNICADLGIQRCSDYSTKINDGFGKDTARLACEQDKCDVGKYGPAEENGKCWWDTETNTCKDSLIVNPCGNDAFEPEIFEECDGNWDFETEKWNYYFGKILDDEWEDDTENSCGLLYPGSTGKLACKRPLLDVLNPDQCKFDLSDCSCENENSPICGNNNKECGEICDGTDLGNMECPCGGTLKCASDCGGYDYSGCITPCSPSSNECNNNGSCDTGETCSNCGSDCGSCCGNSLIEGIEECDKTNLSGRVCTDYDDNTGGILTCNADCTINTTQCTKPGQIPSVCNDSRIDAPETCDGIWNSSKKGWDFMTFGNKYKNSTVADTCKLYYNSSWSGNLSCYKPGTSKECTIDKSDCVGPGFPPVTPGIKYPGVCDYTTLTEDTCEDDGFLDYSWTAKWIPAYPNQPRLLSCEDGFNKIECPAAIPLPFFDWITLIVTLVAIALVYWGIRVVKSKKR